LTHRIDAFHPCYDETFDANPQRRVMDRLECGSLRLHLSVRLQQLS